MEWSGMEWSGGCMLIPYIILLIIANSDNNGPLVGKEVSDFKLSGIVISFINDRNFSR